MGLVEWGFSCLKLVKVTATCVFLWLGRMSVRAAMSPPTPLGADALALVKVQGESEEEGIDDGRSDRRA